MNRKTKTVLIYIATTLVILLIAELVDGRSILEILFNHIGLSAYTHGDTGGYIPTLLGIGIIFLLRTILKRAHLQYKNYFYHCFGMVLVLALIQKVWLTIINTLA